MYPRMRPQAADVKRGRFARGRTSPAYLPLPCSSPLHEKTQPGRSCSRSDCHQDAQSGPRTAAAPRGGLPLPLRAGSHQGAPCARSGIDQSPARSGSSPDRSTRQPCSRAGSPPGSPAQSRCRSPGRSCSRSDPRQDTQSGPRRAATPRGGLPLPLRVGSHQSSPCARSGIDQSPPPFMADAN